MKTCHDVVQTLESLRDNLDSDRGSWENPTLERYLEAMAAWLGAHEMAKVEQPSWELMCEMLEAAKIYE
jgi:hypothetical protein